MRFSPVMVQQRLPFAGRRDQRAERPRGMACLMTMIARSNCGQMSPVGSAKRSRQPDGMQDRIPRSLDAKPNDNIP